ncbi:MAG: hypothetical protein E4H02_02080 [Lentisphaerales bacterium]|jgi:hypothetical protein|nr:MAG: hypothetical protein E4H02_02080 [Lentisphaerales bacterium]
MISGDYKLLLVCLIFFLVSGHTLQVSAQDDLFFSEYCEGSSNNKYVEIFNGTDIPISMSSYNVQIAFNADPWIIPMSLSGTLPTGEVYVVCSSMADESITSRADLVTEFLHFDGNDAVGLFRAGVLIDIVGRQGEDPVSGWDVAGTAAATRDHVLLRKWNVTSGNTNWTASAGSDSTNSEWIVCDQDMFSYLGYHLTSPGLPPAVFFEPLCTNMFTTAHNPLTFSVTAMELEGDSITLEAVSLPIGSSFTNATGTSQVTSALEWTPASTGVFSAVFSATDKDGSCTLAANINVTPPWSGSIWINEIHYDNDGADTNEGVEVAGVAGTDLSAYTLYFYNGADSQTYDSNARLDLFGLIDNERRGYGAAWFPHNGIQNGSPDGVALVRSDCWPQVVIQFLSYEGSFMAANGPALGVQSLDINVVEPADSLVGYSVQLHGPGTNYCQFEWSGPQPHSRGEFNPGQRITVPGMFMIVR